MDVLEKNDVLLSSIKARLKLKDMINPDARATAERALQAAQETRERALGLELARRSKDSAKLLLKTTTQTTGQLQPSSGHPPAQASSTNGTPRSVFHGATAAKEGNSGHEIQGLDYMDEEGNYRVVAVSPRTTAAAAAEQKTALLVAAAEERHLLAARSAGLEATVRTLAGSNARLREELVRALVGVEDLALQNGRLTDLARALEDHVPPRFLEKAAVLLHNKLARTFRRKGLRRSFGRWASAAGVPAPRPGAFRFVPPPAALAAEALRAPMLGGGGQPGLTLGRAGLGGAGAGAPARAAAAEGWGVSPGGRPTLYPRQGLADPGFHSASRPHGLYEGVRRAAAGARGAAAAARGARELAAAAHLLGDVAALPEGAGAGAMPPPPPRPAQETFLAHTANGDGNFNRGRDLASARSDYSVWAAPTPREERSSDAAPVKVRPTLGVKSAGTPRGITLYAYDDSLKVETTELSSQPFERGRLVSDLNSAQYFDWADPTPRGENSPDAAPAKKVRPTLGVKSAGTPRGITLYADDDSLLAKNTEPNSQSPRVQAHERDRTLHDLESARYSDWADPTPRKEKNTDAPAKVRPTLGVKSAGTPRGITLHAVDDSLAAQSTGLNDQPPRPIERELATPHLKSEYSELANPTPGEEKSSAILPEKEQPALGLMSAGGKQSLSVKMAKPEQAKNVTPPPSFLVGKRISSPFQVPSLKLPFQSENPYEGIATLRTSSGQTNDDDSDYEPVKFTETPRLIRRQASNRSVHFEDEGGKAGEGGGDGSGGSHPAASVTTTPLVDPGAVERRRGNVGAVNCSAQPALAEDDDIDTAYSGNEAVRWDGNSVGQLQLLTETTDRGQWAEVARRSGPASSLLPAPSPALNISTTGGEVCSLLLSSAKPARELRAGVEDGEGGLSGILPPSPDQGSLYDSFAQRAAAAALPWEDSALARPKGTVVSAQRPGWTYKADTRLGQQEKDSYYHLLDPKGLLQKAKAVGSSQIITVLEKEK